MLHGLFVYRFNGSVLSSAFLFTFFENARGDHIHAGAAHAEKRSGATKAFRKQPCTRAAGLQHRQQQRAESHGAQLKDASAFECDVFCRCCDAPARESGP